MLEFPLQVALKSQRATHRRIAETTDQARLPRERNQLVHRGECFFLQDHKKVDQRARWLKEEAA